MPQRRKRPRQQDERPGDQGAGNGAEEATVPANTCSDTVSHVSKGGQLGPKGKKDKPQHQAEQLNAEPRHKEMALFDTVKSCPDGIEDAVEAWVKRYKGARDAGTSDIMQCILEACGMTGCNAQPADQAQLDELTRKLQQTAVQEGTEDHFKGRKGAHVLDAYLAMWEQLVQTMLNNDLLSDNLLQDNLLHLVISLSTKELRHFRYVATLTACQLLKEWAQALKIYKQRQETSSRQLQAEQQKGKSAVARRVEAFQREANKAQQQADGVLSLMQAMITAVQSLRFRDVSPEIRALVVDTFGQLIKTVPSEFLGHSHLKYLAWALYDAAGNVREAAVSALTMLYQDNALRSGLAASLADRFVNTYREMVYDVDDKVAAKALRLLLHVPHVERTSLAMYGDMLVDKSPLVRDAAADVITSILQDLGQHHLEVISAHSSATPPRTSARTRTAASGHGCATVCEKELAGLVHLFTLLACKEARSAEEMSGPLLQLYTTATDPWAAQKLQHAVDTLFNRVTVLQEWSVLIRAMEDKKSIITKDIDVLSTCLLRIVQAVVQRATAPPPANMLGKAARDWSRTADVAQQHITNMLVKPLPGLLARYKDSADQLEPLCSMLQHLKWDVYQLKQQEKQFDVLLKQVEEAVFRFSDTSLLQTISMAVASMAEQSIGTMKDKVQTFLTNLADKVVARLTSAVSSLSQLNDATLQQCVQAFEQDHTSSQQLYSTHANLARVTALMWHNPEPAKQAGLVDVLFSLLEDMCAQLVYGPGISILALNASFTYFLWHMAILQQQAAASGKAEMGPGTPAGTPQPLRQKGRRAAALLGSSGAAGTQDDVQGVLQLRNALLSKLHIIAQHSEYDSVSQKLLTLLCDIHVVLSPKLASDNGTSALTLPTEETEYSLAVLWSIAEDILNGQVTEGSSSQAETAVANAKISAVQCVGRVLRCVEACHVAPLAAKLLGHWAFHGTEVEEAIDEVHCRVKERVGPDNMASLYLLALKVLLHIADEHEEEDVPSSSQQGDMLEAAQILAAKLAQELTAWPERELVLQLCDGVIDMAVADREKLKLLTLLTPFATLCEDLKAKLDIALGSTQPDESDSRWEPYFDLLTAIEQAAHKAPAKRKRGRATTRRAVHFEEEEEGVSEDTSDAAGSDDGAEDAATEAAAAAAERAWQANLAAQINQRAARARRRHSLASPTEPALRSSPGDIPTASHSNEDVVLPPLTLEELPTQSGAGAGPHSSALGRIIPLLTQEDLPRGTASPTQASTRADDEARQAASQDYAQGGASKKRKAGQVQHSPARVQARSRTTAHNQPTISQTTHTTQATDMETEGDEDEEEELPKEPPRRHTRRKWG